MSLQVRWSPLLLGSSASLRTGLFSFCHVDSRDRTKLSTWPQEPLSIELSAGLSSALCGAHFNASENTN